MKIRSLWIFQANSEGNKITEVTPLTKFDGRTATQMFNPLYKTGGVCSRLLFTSRSVVQHKILMISGNER